jgi:hypothetical protein
MLQSISIEAGDGRDAALEGVQQIANRCPNNERSNLFRALERNDFLQELLKEQKPIEIAHLLKVIFENASEQETAEVLGASTTWKTLENKKELDPHLELYRDNNVRPLIPRTPS